MLNTLQYCVKHKDFKGIRRCIKRLLPPKVESELIFRKNYNRWIHYKNPVLFDEKLLILKGGEYYNNQLVTMCADKYLVRKYVDSKNLGNILVELYGTYENAEDIPFDKLPAKYVLKCNHGCGMNLIITDHTSIELEKVKTQLNEWIGINYGFISGERHYDKIEPRIIVEKYIGAEDGTLPIDYKFYASRGNVIYCLIITGRGGDQQRIFVDKEFHHLPFSDFNEENARESYASLKPEKFSDMVQVAEKLSEDFPFVRVDLYSQEGNIYFGELTFTPHGCYHDYLNDSAQEWIGK